MKGAFDSRTIVIIKFTDARNDFVNFVRSNFVIANLNLTIHKARHWKAPEVHDDF